MADYGGDVCFVGIGHLTWRDAVPDMIAEQQFEVGFSCREHFVSARVDLHTVCCYRGARGYEILPPVNSYDADHA